MCTLISIYKKHKDYPIILAENRDADKNLKEKPPHIPCVNPKIFCALDIKSQGTWIGLNEYKVVVGLTNLYPENKIKIKSRGHLCLEALKEHTAKEACDFIVTEYETNQYQKVNMFCCDLKNAYLIKCNNYAEVIPLGSGVHVLTNYDFREEPKTNEDLQTMFNSKHRRERALEILNDLTFDNVEKNIDLLKTVCRDHQQCPYAIPKLSKYYTKRFDPFSLKRGLNLCTHSDSNRPYKTTSSTIIAVGLDLSKTKYLYSAGNPCENEYHDYSFLFNSSYHSFH